LTLDRIGWWSLVLVCLMFGAFALWMGAAEFLALAHVVDETKERAAPVAFVIHALAGGIALMAGPFQFNQRIRDGNRPLHRFVGHVYVVAVWAASLGGLWNAIFFPVEITARVAFAVAGILWFTATTIAFDHARGRRIDAHRRWMIRSFAISLFFVTFEFWVMAFKNTGLVHEIAYPLGVFMGWFLNLIVAEAWIRRQPRLDMPASTA
jgi:uncharacterized membrane protein